jgi:hypothetical protein
MAEAVPDLLQLLFLLLIAAAGGSAGWILLLREFSSEGSYLGLSVRWVMVLSFAKGRDLRCSSRSFLFRVGVAVAGDGLFAGLGDFTPPPPTVGLLILVQRIRSVLAAAPGRWLLRLYQGLRPTGGAVGVLGVGAFSSSLGGARSTRKKNRMLRDLLLIFTFYGVLFVIGRMYCAAL